MWSSAHHHWSCPPSVELLLLCLVTPAIAVARMSGAVVAVLEIVVRHAEAVADAALDRITRDPGSVQFRLDGE